MTKPISDEELAELDKSLEYMAPSPSEYCEYTYDEIAALRERLRLADACIEAAESVLSECAVREHLLCYNMGFELICRVEAYRAAKEGGE